MGNSATYPTEKKIEPVEGLDSYYIELDLSDRTVIYDYLLQKKIRKENGKWKFESYSKVNDKNKTTTKQIALMYHFLNEIRLFEKRGPREETEQAKDYDKELEEDENEIHDWMKKQFFRSQFENTENANQIPYCALPVYYPGDTVRGKLHLTTSKKFNLEKINLDFIGSAKTRYRVYHGRGYYDSMEEEKYIDKKLSLWTKDDSFSGTSTSPSGGADLPPGEYEWPFEFQIPVDGIISSVPCLNPCTVFYNYVAYRLKAVLDKGNMFNRGGIATCQGIWVEKEADVAANMENMNPIVDKKYQQTGVFNDGHIELHVKLPKAGYVVGEDVPVSIEVDNRSGGVVEEIEAKVVLSGKYVTGKSKLSCSKSFKHEANPVKAGPIANGESPHFDWTLNLIFSNTEIDEHLLPPTDLNCNLMYVKYNVVVTAKRKAMHRDVTLKVPITIGNTNSKEMKTFSYLHDLNPEP